MDEYIKREDAMKALDEYRLSHTMSMHGDMELLMEFRYGVVGAMNALAFVPTADVAPKSEVANEVLDEAIRTVYSKIDMKIYNTIDGKPLSDHVAYGKQMAMYDVITLLAELKNKYTEAGNNEN